LTFSFCTCLSFDRVSFLFPDFRMSSVFTHLFHSSSCNLFSLIYFPFLRHVDR
jgi:hypothetical protein